MSIPVGVSNAIDANMHDFEDQDEITAADATFALSFYRPTAALAAIFFTILAP